MKRWLPLLGGAVGGATAFLFGWPGTIAICAIMALALAWTMGRAYEAGRAEKAMMRISLEAFSTYAEETLADASQVDDLDDEELESVAKLKRDYHRAQDLLRRLR